MPGGAIIIVLTALAHVLFPSSSPQLSPTDSAIVINHSFINGALAKLQFVVMSLNVGHPTNSGQ